MNIEIRLRKFEKVVRLRCCFQPSDIVVLLVLEVDLENAENATPGQITETRHRIWTCKHRTK